MPLFQICKHMLNRLFPLFVNVPVRFRVPQVIGFFQVMRPDVAADPLGAILVAIIILVVDVFVLTEKAVLRVRSRVRHDRPDLLIQQPFGNAGRLVAGIRGNGSRLPKGGADLSERFLKDADVMDVARRHHGPQHKSRS